MSDQKSISSAAWAQILLLALIWGGIFLSISFVLREVGPFTAVLHRTFWAMLVLWLVSFAMGLRVPRDARTWGAFAVMGVLNNVLPFSLLTWGQTHIESGLVSIFNASTAVFGVLIAALVFADEKLTLRKAVGVAFGFFGVATAMGLENLKALDLRSLAQIACICAAICYGCAGSWGRARLSHLPPQLAAAGMLTCATVVMLPIALVMDGPISLALQPGTWIAIGYSALVATAGAFLLYYSIMAKAGSGNLMLVTLLVAPIAILLGAVVLGETLFPRHYAGFLLIACGLSMLDGRILRLFRPDSGTAAG